MVGHLASSAEDATVVSIELVAGVDAATAGGVGVGSSEADLRAELGDPIMEPFTGAWLYPDRGIAVQWQDGAVSSVHLFAP